MTEHILANAELAREFLRTRAVGSDTHALVRRVEGWLATAGLNHRSALDVAAEVLRIEAERRVPEPRQQVVDSAEEAARVDDLRQGIGDQRQPLTADDVLQMDIRAYAKLREQLGIGQGASARGIYGQL